MLSERWHPHTMKVTADLVASGILTDEALDEVAQRLLWPDRPTWTHPSSWFGIEFAVAPGPSRSPRHDTSPDRLVRTTLPAPRGVVRRWAATHLLRRGLTDVDSVVARCEGLSAYDADAVVAGIVEAIDAMPELESELAVALGLAAATATPGCSRCRRCLFKGGSMLRSAALNKTPLPGSAPGRQGSCRANNTP